jgi:hypothetical protein
MIIQIVLRNESGIRNDNMNKEQTEKAITADIKARQQEMDQEMSQEEKEAIELFKSLSPDWDETEKQLTAELEKLKKEDSGSEAKK